MMSSGRDLGVLLRRGDGVLRPRGDGVGVRRGAGVGAGAASHSGVAGGTCRGPGSFVDVDGVGEVGCASSDI